MSKAAEYQERVIEAAAAACSIVKECGYLMPYDAMLKDVISQMQAGDCNGRTISWRARLRIFTEHDGFETPQADSDPDLAPDAEGETHLGGLPAVADWARDCIQAHHAGEPCGGLTDTTLARKIKGLRTQMSGRGDGSGVMRLPYEVKQGDSTVRMLARVDVVRGSAVAPRRSFTLRQS